VPPTSPGDDAGPGDGGRARTGYLQALAAVALFSTSPVLVRRAETVSAVEITFWRLAIAAATVALFAAVARRPVRWGRISPRPFAAYGVVIALHFYLYIAALFFTTVAHALALVYTAPLFIAVLSRIFLGERMPPRRWLGVGLAVLGVAVLTGFEPQAGPGTLLGDLLATGSAVTFAVYSVIGRARRDAYPLFDYATGIYAWGAVWLLPLALWRFPGSEYPPGSVLALVGLGVGPLGTGHTLYNAALRRIPATSANLIATLEVVGGVALSALLLGEVPSGPALIGAGVVLAGILLVLR
jgi:drug/metabolite transporter (DMT)-like permease